jgi:hypothetical protein
MKDIVELITTSKTGRRTQERWSIGTDSHD